MSLRQELQDGARPEEPLDPGAQHGQHPVDAGADGRLDERGWGALGDQPGHRSAAPQLGVADGWGPEPPQPSFGSGGAFFDGAIVARLLDLQPVLVERRVQQRRRPH